MDKSNVILFRPIIKPAGQFGDAAYVRVSNRVKEDYVSIPFKEILEESYDGDDQQFFHDCRDIFKEYWREFFGAVPGLDHWKYLNLEKFIESDLLRESERKFFFEFKRILILIRYCKLENIKCSDVRVEYDTSIMNFFLYKLYNRYQISIEIATEVPICDFWYRQVLKVSSFIGVDKLLNKFRYRSILYFESLVLSHYSRNASRIGVVYSGKNIECDDIKKSEYWWFQGSRDILKNVLIYFVPTVAKNCQGSVGLAEFNHVIWNGLDKQNCFTKETQALIKKYQHLLYALNLSADWYYYFDNFFKKYATRLAFYVYNQIRVELVPMYLSNATSGAALVRLGGKTIAYQYSVSNRILPFYYGYADELALIDEVDRLFLEQLASHRPVAHVTGYPYLHLMKQKKRCQALEHVRSSLKSDFVITYFPESFVSDWSRPHSSNPGKNGLMHFLINWVLEDPRISLIVKPKHFDLGESIFADLREFIDMALKTGRFYMATESGSHLGEYYAFQYAAISDLVIGEPTGGTAVLESYLMNKPAYLVEPVSIETGNLYYIEAYKNGYFHDHIEFRRFVNDSFPVIPKAAKCGFTGSNGTVKLEDLLRFSINCPNSD